MANEGVELNDARTKMYEVLKNIEECDYVFITGDVAHKGNYGAVSDRIQELATCINYNESDRSEEKKEQFFWTAGNHDIARVGSKTTTIHDIRRGADMLLAYEEALNDEGKRVWLGLLGYTDYFSSIETLSRDKSKRANMRNLGSHNQELHRIVLLPDVNLIVLNSCLLSCDDNDAGNLFVLDSKFVRDFDRIYDEESVKKMIKNKKPTFVLAHHGKDCFHQAEYRRLVERFAGKVDLYLCGHSHQLLYSKFYDPDVDREATRSTSSHVIHQYTCGIGTLNGENSKMAFLHGLYADGKITIIAYLYESGQWVQYRGDKVRPNIEIQRFKREYRLKKNDFKLYVTGAQGVGKTAITKQLLNILKNTEALQIAEVDFVKDALRKDIEINDERFKSLLDGLQEKPQRHEKLQGARKGKASRKTPKKTTGVTSSIALLLRDASEHILGDAEDRLAMIASSYELNIAELEKQSGYIFPRLMNAIERHTEKGIPAIIEGLNIPLDQLIKYYREKTTKENDFSLDSIMIINLSVDSIDNHRNRMNLRITDRQLEKDEATKQLEHLNNLYAINQHCIAMAEKAKKENPDIRIYNIDNSGQKDKYTVAMEIIDLIAKSDNFVE